MICPKCSKQPVWLMYTCTTDRVKVEWENDHWVEASNYDTEVDEQYIACSECNSSFHFDWGTAVTMVDFIE